MSYIYSWDIQQESVYSIELYMTKRVFVTVTVTSMADCIGDEALCGSRVRAGQCLGCLKLKALHTQLLEGEDLRSHSLC